MQYLGKGEKQHFLIRLMFVDHVRVVNMLGRFYQFCYLITLFQIKFKINDKTRLMPSSHQLTTFCLSSSYLWCLPEMPGDTRDTRYTWCISYLWCIPRHLRRMVTTRSAHGAWESSTDDSTESYCLTKSFRSLAGEMSWQYQH